MDTLTLSDIPTGERATVVNFRNGRGIAGRLTSLGFTPGAEVSMVQNFGRGPLIVSVRGSRVALGRGEAAKIFVQRGQA